MGAVKYLVKMGADITIKSVNNEIALDLAKKKKNKNCIIALTEAESEQFDNEWIKCEISHGRTSTIIDNYSNFEKMIKKTDITPLMLRESEREKQLKLESVTLRKEIKSLQSDTTKLKLSKQEQYETKIVKQKQRLR